MPVCMGFGVVIPFVGVGGLVGVGGFVVFGGGVLLAIGVGGREVTGNP